MIERKVVCVEGTPFPGQHTIIMKGALYLEDDDKIPVTAGFDHQKILGYARNLQRDIESGEVSMELVIHPSFDVNLDEFSATISVHPFMASKAKDDENLTLINAGRIREVALNWEK